MKKSKLAPATTSGTYLIVYRKHRDVADVLAAGFSWTAAIDAAADVYNGVSTGNDSSTARTC